jgi:hypothetical protein
MYLNASFQRNCDAPVSYAGQHSVDVLTQKALGFLDEAAANPARPFFLGIAPVAPHSNVKASLFDGDNPTDNLDDDIDDLVTFTPPIPAARHAHLFANVTVPRTPHFNPDHPSGANWIRTLPKLSYANVEFNDHFYRQRLRTLQSVDELVDSVVNRLEELGLLEETYIFYTTDNGYHIGQHRLQPGKECGFEEDINIPLIVRGPGVPKGEVSEVVTAHVDLAPTILGIATGDGNVAGGEEGRSVGSADFDGEAIPLTKAELEEAVHSRHEHVTVEFWGFAASEGRLFGDGEKRLHLNNTYKALRVIGKEYNLYYSVWCTNEHELYDLKVCHPLTPILGHTDWFYRRTPTNSTTSSTAPPRPQPPSSACPSKKSLPGWTRCSSCSSRARARPACGRGTPCTRPATSRICTTPWPAALTSSMSNSRRRCATTAASWAISLRLRGRSLRRTGWFTGRGCDGVSGCKRQQVDRKNNKITLDVARVAQLRC